MAVSSCIFVFFVAIFLLKVVVPFVSVLFVYSVGKSLYSKRKLLKQAGEWAIVTGATDGIGKSYVKELAKDGLNIMLISRNPDKLKAVAQEIESEYGVVTKTVACDFTRVDIYETLEKEVGALSSIACLVNNVGMSYPSLDAFASADFINLDFIRNLIHCNVNSVASLTRIVLPRLRKQSSVGSAIINLSSFSGLQPFPYLAFYGASKAFIHHFTEALSSELKDSGVIMQCVCPLLVATSMSKIKKTSFFVPSADRYASSALDMLGVEKTTIGYFGHALQAALLSIHPMLVAFKAKSAYLFIKNRKKTL